MSDTPTDITRRYFRAWADHDRSAMEDLVAEDFRFTSPLDNGLDRATFFRRCWPPGADITRHARQSVGAQSRASGASSRLSAGIPGDA